MKDTTKNTYLAVDFGGGSGRVIAGSLLQGKLELEEIHRFTNRQVKLGNHVYWDFPALFEDMKTGLKLAAQKGYHVKGIGIDTWGVDFGLIDKKGNLLGNPVCYRDARTDGMPDKVFQILDAQKHYACTGIQVMPINTLFQLYSMQQNQDVLLEVAQRLLLMPDLFSYYLTGVANNEYCIASTSELLDARQRNWSMDTIRALGLPEHLFGEIILPGTVRGTLKEEIGRETGLACVKLQANPGEEYMFRERGLGAGAITEIFNNVHQQYKDLTEEQLARSETSTSFRRSFATLPEVFFLNKSIIPTISTPL